MLGLMNFGSYAVFRYFSCFPPFVVSCFLIFMFPCLLTYTGTARSSVKTLVSEDLESRYLLVLALSMDSAVDAFLGLH